MNVLRRQFTGEIKGIDEREQTLTAYITTNARDRMDEVLEPSGADIRQFRKNPVVLFAHSYAEPPIGKALWTKPDDKGIVSKVKFASTAFAQEIFNLYKEGFMKAFSVGFIPKEWTDGDGKKTPKRTYTKWELLEYSAVPVPANPEALTNALQRGIISEQTKHMLEEKEEHKDNPTEATDDAPAEPEPEQEQENKEKEATGLDELMAENKQLLDKLNNLELENTELKCLLFKAYNNTEKPDKKTISEMTGEDLAKLIGEGIAGVIREVTGRVS